MTRSYLRRAIDWSDPAAKAEYNRAYFRAHHVPGTIKPESGYAKSVTINGVPYPSLAAAARAIGITRQRMSAIVQRDGETITRDDPREGYDID